MSEIKESSDPRTTDGNLSARPQTSLNARPEPRQGIAPIKAEFLVDLQPIVEASSSKALNDNNTHMDDDAAEGRGNGDSRDSRDNNNNRGAKRQKLSKKDRGQNKNRKFPTMRDTTAKVCRTWELTGECNRPGCKFEHSWAGYFSSKPGDLQWEPVTEYNVSEEPYVVHKERIVAGEDDIGSTVDLATACPVYMDLGYCTFGWRCRFLGGHIRKVDAAVAAAADPAGKGPNVVGQWELTGRPTKEQAETSADGRKFEELNWPEFSLIARLRQWEFDFSMSKAYLDKIEPNRDFTLMRNFKPAGSEQNGAAAAAAPAPADEMDEEAAMNISVTVQATESTPAAAAQVAEIALSAEEAAMNAESTALEGQNGKVHVYAEHEAIDVPLRPEEKRRLNWENGLYLAPLTTVGNLPFRRLCVSYGATITISEMALAQPLVYGQTDEFALLRRHESEKMFGVQVAGGYANRMVPVAEMIGKEFAKTGGIDFVDVNLGCPIDLVFNQGAGSALLDSPARLGRILVGMNRALGEIPLTVKFRMGVQTGKPNAHKLIPRFASEWGASALTLHGRSRQQRYSKLADWAYIKQCAETLRATVKDEGLPPVPIFGNGDCFSAQSYYEEKEKAGVDGVMVARGALIKPWIFTEIQERREWDISATERLDGIKKFAEFGLSHWGSDTQGVAKTRRFLCEALSFQHRYIPIGLLERLPPMLNDRPPAYKGRSELETLLSSPFAGDWVKISEMFLGKAEGDWKFTPKHKSNAYGGEEAQG